MLCHTVIINFLLSKFTKISLIQKFLYLFLISWNWPSYCYLFIYLIFTTNNEYGVCFLFIYLYRSVKLIKAIHWSTDWLSFLIFKAALGNLPHKNRFIYSTWDLFRLRGNENNYCCPKYESELKDILREVNPKNITRFIHPFSNQTIINSRNRF